MNAKKSRGRMRRFRLAVMLLAPVLCLLLLEGGLRLAGYGFSPSFFIEEPGAIRTNPDFGRICFPPELARLPISERLADPKPSDEYRIFILGSSAAQGFPMPAYSFGRLLEVMLEERYPETRFKVVNAALDAISSHIAFPIAKDAIDREADLLIVYMGNSEVAGPFGPGTIFSDFSSNISSIRASLAAKRARTWQLLGNLLSLGRTRSAGWAGMEMFVENHVAADDRRLQRVYDNFKRNLSDIVGSAREKGLPVIVSTLATNLKDSPPFGSMHRSDLSSAELEEWETAFGAGVELEASGLPAEAAARYREALRIDSRYAELHFRLARCLLEMGEAAEAREAYLQAQELDTLRFRADAGINAAVMEVAGGRERQGIHLVDAAGAFAGSAWSADGIPGEELFDDHLHMNFTGSHLLASELFEKVAAILPSSITGEGRVPEAPSPGVCAQRLVFTEWERWLQLQLLGELAARPPFTGQVGHEKRKELNKERIRRFDRAISIARLREVAALYKAEIAGAGDDHWLRIGYAQLLVRLGEMDEAVRQLSDVITDNPLHRDALLPLAGILAKQERYEEEARYLDRLLEIEPFSMQARNRQAENMMQRGMKEESVQLYSKLMEDYPGNAHIHAGLARALLGQGKVAEATDLYREALRIDPAFSEARADLVQLNVSRGNLPAAIAECEEWIALASRETAPLLTLAGILEKSGDAEAAAAKYKKAIALDPHSFRARIRYGTLLQKRGALSEATAFHLKMLESDPDIPAGHYLLGISLARQGKSVEAVAELRQELLLMPESPLALGALARLLSSNANPHVRDGVAAVAIAERLAAVARDDPAALDAIAMAYAEFGDFDRALEAQTRAVQLLRAHGQREQARLRKYMARLQLYRAGTPYRQ